LLSEKLLLCHTVAVGVESRPRALFVLNEVV
jgi:hypothetical protein